MLRAPTTVGRPNPPLESLPNCVPFRKFAWLCVLRASECACVFVFVCVCFVCLRVVCVRESVCACVCMFVCVCVLRSCVYVCVCACM